MPRPVGMNPRQPLIALFKRNRIRRIRFADTSRNYKDMSNSDAADTVVAAHQSFVEASTARENAEQAFQSSQQALTSALKNLDGAQQLDRASVNAKAQQSYDEFLRQRAETRANELAVGQTGEPESVPPEQMQPENVSNEGDEGNPLAQENEIDIMGEGTQEENTGGAGDTGKADRRTAENVGENLKFESWDDFNGYIKYIGKCSNLSIDEKVKKIQEAYNGISDKTDINIPIDAKYVKNFSEDGKVIFDWPKYLGFDKTTIASISRSNMLPENCDRYGPMSGSNFADVPLEGKYSYSERSLPYVENEKAYHSVRFNNITYFDKIDAIRFGNLDALNKELELEGISKLDASDFENICEDYNDYIKRIGKEIGSDFDATYGIKGNAVAWGDLKGGAGQIITPFDGNVLKALGILKE